MKTCIIDSVEIEPALIRVGLVSFGRNPGVDSLPYSIRVDVDTADGCFGAYFSDFLDRESEDDGSGYEPSGIYLELKSAGYPAFPIMAEREPGLLARLILEQLPAEFVGYLYQDNESSFESKKYILQTLEDASVSEGVITCSGLAFANPRYVG
ncbi:hypothetical protein [Lysobacter sp. ESA13C]|uniref:hypothetical protein n=1 Tax=unclassified Lysobacter TaxID=2635362 RepID=UPI001CBD0DBC|nr:hypothetical protein [Lysobacter sp. ESA13C]